MQARLGVDIGGTFTDVALEAGGRRFSAKIPTTPEAPEMREYERFSTACANACVQSMIGRYLRSLEARLAAEGFRVPVFLMLSGGGLTTVATGAGAVACPWALSQ